MSEYKIGQVVYAGVYSGGGKGEIIALFRFDKEVEIIQMPTGLSTPGPHVLEGGSEVALVQLNRGDGTSAILLTPVEEIRDWEVWMGTPEENEVAQEEAEEEKAEELADLLWSRDETTD